MGGGGGGRGWWDGGGLHDVEKWLNLLVLKTMVRV